MHWWSIWMTVGLIPNLDAVASSGEPETLSAAPERAPVDVRVDWRDVTARLVFAVPAGQHVAPDAPLSAVLEVAGDPWSVHTLGVSARRGLPVPLPDARPVTLAGTVTLSVCDDAGTTCRVVEQVLQGALDTPKGRGMRLDPVAPPAVEAKPSTSFDEVLAGAGEDLVLIDFGAVWCPPCNLLSAELLHDPEDAALLEGIQLFEVDVDDHSSWAIKDRYAVGGYPTLVAVDASGAEVARLVGYPGEAETKDWLDGLDTTVPLSSAPDPEALTPEEAGAWARRFVEGQRSERAAPYLARAASGASVVLDAQVASYILEPTADRAHALAEAGVPVTTWGWSALAFVDEDPSLAERIQGAARRAIARSAPRDAGDLFYMLAKVSPEAVQPDLYRSAAVAVTASMSGDLERDRGHIGWLSRLWEYAGDTDRAAAVLAPALERWPRDMTFHEDRAALAFRTGDFDTAIREGALAFEYGLGDNRLRVLETYAKALDAAGRTEEARSLVQKTLRDTPAPPDELNVRTPRYLRALRALPFLDADPSAP